jgi:D-alanyl-D-alanine carboxypeptidase/D-alanyl-D-alanine carboxypeptidase (penicillin-binding protein 5/6)
MKDKKVLIYLLLLSTFLISMMALFVSAEVGINVNAKSSALYNPDTKSFLYQKNASTRLPLASTTKIVTALIAIETLDPDEIIKVPRDAVGIEGSSLYLAEGDELTANDLIHGVLLQSANDAATVLALRISGSIGAFAEKMTDRAKKIGAENTNFENPHGLDSDEHYTTAHDLSVIAAEALNNDTFRKIVSTYKYTFKIGDKTRTIVNHNKLLKSYDGCIGVKTGYTRKSGRCLVSAAEKDGVTLIAVTLNDPDDWNDHTDMLNYGFDKLESVDLTEVVKLPQYIPTVSSDGATVNIELEKKQAVKLKSDTITYQLDVPTYIASDIKCGDKVGELTLKIGDNQEKIDIVAKSDVKIKGTKRRFL